MNIPDTFVCALANDRNVEGAIKLKAAWPSKANARMIRIVKSTKRIAPRMQVNAMCDVVWSLWTWGGHGHHVVAQVHVVGQFETGHGSAAEIAYDE